MVGFQLNLKFCDISLMPKKIEFAVFLQFTGHLGLMSLVFLVLRILHTIDFLLEKIIFEKP